SPLKVLVTSRILLSLVGEYQYAIPALRLPDRRTRPSLELLSEYESVRFFLDRAQAIKPDFALTQENAGLIIEICHRLDGLPLAMELATARIRHYPLKTILERLDQRMTLVQGQLRNLPMRQQTIRGVFDWSYQLLSAGEQALFRRLGVFVGGWTIEAAEAICRLDDDLDVAEGLGSLIDKSMIILTQEADHTARYTMLETIRAYAVDRIDLAGESEPLRHGHAHYYRRWSESKEAESGGSHQREWLSMLELERD